MTGQDWLIFCAALAIVGAVAYSLGARRRESPPARAAAPSPEPAAAKPEPEAESEAEADVTATATAEEKAPATEEKPAEPEEPAAVPKLYVSDDDGDGDVDVTRVGSLGVPPLRAIIQPPVNLLDEEGIAAVSEPTDEKPYFLVSATAQTDTGLRRKQNEDSLLVLREKNLFVVADGMGGHKGGELASSLAVKAIEDAFVAGTFEGKPHEGVPPEASDLARAIQMANATILETAKAKPALEGMGTTVVCARFSPTKRRLHIGHVGDSRCYRLRDGIFKQLTADHTMAELGMTGPESANLSRAVGIWSTVPIDVVVGAPLPSDIYLLCSDGLTKMLDDERIAHVLRTEEDPQAAVDRLIFFANARGGKDNITVILVRVVEPTPDA
ncbi:MAG: serine/threonine phosphatase PrpC [Labilithrix sp.]|nr:serine/threonine phosphatase PrpC [Labilithrix sp.]